MTKQHKRTPWHCRQLIGVAERGFAIFWTNENGSTKTTHRVDLGGEFSKEDAEFIVRACNNHDNLVELLSLAIEHAGFRVSGPTDLRAAENGEPAWVCGARAALAEACAIE